MAPRGPFDGEKDIGFEVSEEHGRLSVRTEGLSRYAHPELALGPIQDGQLAAGRYLLARLAEQAINQQALPRGETIYCHDEELSFFLRLHAVNEGTGAEQLFALDADPEESPEANHYSADGSLSSANDPKSAPPPKMLIATAMVSMAHRALRQGDERAAEALLRGSISLWPGAPATQRTSAPTLTAPVQPANSEETADTSLAPQGAIPNSENHLAYWLLCSLGVGDALAHYRAALERSSMLRRFELGTTELPSLGRKQLGVSVAEIVKRNLATSVTYEQKHTALVTSPIWEPSADRRVQRAMSVIPRPIARYYHEGAMRERLAKEESLYELSALIYQQHRSDPRFLLEWSWETREIYLGHPVAAEFHDVQRDDERVLRIAIAKNYEPQDKMLSAIIAEIARELSAGLTLDEIRAHSRLTSSSDGRASAEQKLDAQVTHESYWIEDALEEPPLGEGR